MNRKDYCFIKNLDLTKWKDARTEELYWILWSKINKYVNEHYAGRSPLFRLIRRDEMLQKVQIKYARKKGRV